MSRLLGPLSETISSVSERASALAADQIAGAGTIAPAATPVTDLRKSRRFMRCSPTHEGSVGADFARFVPSVKGSLKHRLSYLYNSALAIFSLFPCRGPGRFLAYN